MAEIFERHDRSRFEVTAFSFGPEKQDAMRARVSKAFERFVDVRGLQDAGVAALARKLSVDIAVDLKGHTEDARPGIFAQRAAPVQVAYLGYPGTMGAGYMDYIIADATVIPEAHKEHYTEKVVWLPDSYQANDSTRPISSRTYSRGLEGLPETGFVFCCFNANYKFLPGTFDAWMRILKHVQGSVLWLIEDNAEAVANLRKEAVRRGVDAGRLVFAGRLPQAEHLARQRLADLFLDTLPCNAHTTTSDALWAGLPVLTRSGETFAGRVAASLLKAVGLPELVVATQEAYEALAIALASDPARLAAIRRKLSAARLTSPLFDAARFAHNIEAAYVAMHERHLAGALPDHFAVRG
jgi:predicted O-linked N-acetylglucosamine transferase (SPINDLY family)